MDEFEEVIMKNGLSKDEIAEFTGEYRFLSNFYPAIVIMDGEPYPSIENAYQAAKTLDPELRKPFREDITAAKAKKMGQKLELRADWEEVKLGIMKELVMDKFGHFGLQEKLLATGNVTLIEGNNWHDRFFGVCSCERCKNRGGKNHLGQILMEVRECYRQKKEILDEKG